MITRLYNVQSNVMAIVVSESISKCQGSKDATRRLSDSLYLSPLRYLVPAPVFTSPFSNLTHIVDDRSQFYASSCRPGRHVVGTGLRVPSVTVVSIIKEEDSQ